MQPREAFNLTLATNDVPASFQELQDAALQLKGIVHVGQLTEDNKINVVGTLSFDVGTADKAAIDKLIAKTGVVLKRSNTAAKVNELASERKVGYRLVLNSVASIQPREIITIKVEVADVEAKSAELSKLVRDAKGQAGKARSSLSPKGEMTADLKFNVPLSAADGLLLGIANAGKVVDKDQKQDPAVADNDLSTALIVVTLVGSKPIIGNDEGLGSYVKRSLEISFRVFAWSVMLVILGLSVVLPWVVVIWICWRVARGFRSKPQATTV